MAAGIIPWNATPGKACGSTLGDICNTSEVRGRLLSTHIHTNATHQQRRADWHGKYLFFLFLTVACLFPVLPVLSPVHRSVRRGRSHCDRSGKLPVQSLHPLPFSPSLHGLYQQIMCQELLSSFPYGLCNHAKEDYTQAFPQLRFHLLFTICLDAHGPIFILGWMEESVVKAGLFVRHKGCNF